MLTVNKSVRALALVCVLGCSLLMASEGVSKLTSLIPTRMLTVQKTLPSDSGAYGNKTFFAHADCFCANQKIEFIDSTHIKTSSICSTFEESNEVDERVFEVKNFEKVRDTIRISVKDTATKYSLGIIRFNLIQVSPGLLQATVESENGWMLIQDLMDRPPYLIDVELKKEYEFISQDCGDFQG